MLYVKHTFCMAILKLQPNQTYTLNLKYQKGVEKQGQYGLQFQYTLSDGSILYLPPIAHAEVQSLNVGPDEPFTIRKSIANGNAAVWTVERVPGESSTIVDANAFVHDHRQPKPVTSSRSISRADAIPAPPSLTTRESIRVFQQLCAVIQAAKAAEEFSVSIGYPVKFGPEDIRAMGISGFIEQSRRAAA